MFYAISGINGDYEAYKRALKKLKFQNLDDIKEEDIMNEEAVISTLEGEDVLYVLGNIIGAGGGSMKILQDMHFLQTHYLLMKHYLLNIHSHSSCLCCHFP